MWVVETGNTESGKALREARRRALAEPQTDRTPYETGVLRIVTPQEHRQRFEAKVESDRGE